jgi:hypothetical protein
VLRVPLDDPDQVKNPSRRLSVSDFAPIDFEEVRLRVSTEDGFAERTLWGPFPPGDLQLDELVLQPIPMTLVAAGRVTDAQGRPLAGARILCRNMETSLPLRTASDGSGAFVLRDVVPVPARVQLFATTAEGLSEVLTTSGGAVDVSLAVTRKFCEVTGRVLLAPGVPHDRVRVALWDNWWSYHLSPEDGLDFEGRLDEHGSFTLRRVLPETYVIRVDADWMNVTSVPVETLRPGTVHAVDPVDVNGSLRAIRLTLVSTDAASRFVGTFSAFERKGFGASTPIAFEGSSCVLLSTGEPLAVELCVQGYRTTRLADLRADWTVELEPGWPLRLIAHEELDVPRPSVTWAIALRPVGELTFGEPIEFPGSREVRFVAGESGEFAVAWIRRERAGNSVYESYYRAPDDQRIEIRDVAGEQAFELSPPEPR